MISGYEVSWDIDMRDDQGKRNSSTAVLLFGEWMDSRGPEMNDGKGAVGKGPVYGT